MMVPHMTETSSRGRVAGPDGGTTDVRGLDYATASSILAAASQGKRGTNRRRVRSELDGEKEGTHDAPI